MVMGCVRSQSRAAEAIASTVFISEVDADADPKVVMATMLLIMYHVLLSYGCMFSSVGKSESRTTQIAYSFLSIGSTNFPFEDKSSEMMPILTSPYPRVGDELDASPSQIEQSSLLHFSHDPFFLE